MKPFKLEECILHFWKPPIFINLVVAAQGYSYILNTLKSFLKMDHFIIVSVVAGYISIWPSVCSCNVKHGINANEYIYSILSLVNFIQIFDNSKKCAATIVFEYYSFANIHSSNLFFWTRNWYFCKYVLDVVNSITH